MLIAALLAPVPLFAATSEWVERGVTGRLLYTPDAQGDRVPDFSDVGYRGGRTAIPDVPAAVNVVPQAGDDTASIQAAIDAVSLLPLGADGFRGAVQLAPGQFEVSGTLAINASGVVLRGAGRDAGGTLLRATGTQQRDLIQINGGGSQSLFGSTRNMIDKVVPVGSRSFRVNSTSGFAVGDTVRVERPSPANWISDIGMDMIPPRSDGQPISQWTPGSRNIRYDRVITRIEGDRVFVDAPLTNSFELQYGGGTIREYNWSGGTEPDRIQNIGVENLRAESDFVAADDEDHAWNFVSIDDAQHVWVRDTTSVYFGRSAVLSNPGAKWVTADNVINETPVSRITGGRRYTFDLSGQLELVTNSEANDGRHDFVNNSTRPPGPHVFHRSVANNALDESGPHQRWATGSLFDNVVVDGDQLNAYNRGNRGTGHGWAGANMVIWNSAADSFIVQNPPTAQNWLVGSTGTVIDDQTYGVQEPGYIDSHGTRVDVDSLYEAQLADAADITTFRWGGGVGLWDNPDAWNERLTPGSYAVEMRDYLVGDIDDFANDGASSVDNAFIDPAWEAEIAGVSELPIVGFDDLSGNANVAFTVQHQLNADERVVHGSLALSMKQSGGVVGNDFIRLFGGGDDDRLDFADLGWDTQVNTTDAFVGVVDLGSFTDRLQTGQVNVRLNDDTAVDWALYTATIARPNGDATAARVVIADGGTAVVTQSVGPIAELTVGEAGTTGELLLNVGAVATVGDTYVQHATGKLTVGLNASSAGLLSVEGDASLAGAFELIVDPAFAPVGGETYGVFAVDGTLTGEFADITLPAIAGGDLRWVLDVQPTGVTASVALGGDFNLDGAVDLADYTVWRDSLGSTEDLAADATGDGVVDTDDYAVWVATFGDTLPGATSAIPEPTGAAFALLITLTTYCSTRRSQ